MILSGEGPTPPFSRLLVQAFGTMEVLDLPVLSPGDRVVAI